MNFESCLWTEIKVKQFSQNLESTPITPFHYVINSLTQYSHQTPGTFTSIVYIDDSQLIEFHS